MQLTTQINNQENLLCDFDIFALLLKYFYIITTSSFLLHIKLVLKNCQTTGHLFPQKI